MQSSQSRWPHRRLVPIMIGASLTVAGLAAVPQANPETTTHVEKTGPTLKVGDPAPALKVGRWVKGAPVPELKKGEVYVVEFWATWCAPCKESIPHLTKLAHKYQGKVTVIGVNVWEKGVPQKIDERVDTFVKDMGPNMDYRVGRDTKDGQMVKTWLDASGTSGIPQAFIINREGQVAYLGHPDSIEEELEAVVTGTQDLKAAAEAGRKQAEAMEAKMAESRMVKAAMDKVKPELDRAAEAKEWDKVLALVDRTEAECPKVKLETSFGPRWRFKVAAATDPAKAKGLLEAGLTPESKLGDYFWRIIFLTDVWDTDRRWVELALEYVNQAEAKDSAKAGPWEGIKFMAYLRSDEASAKAWFEARVAKGGVELTDAATTIATTPNLKANWYQSAIPLLQEGKKNPASTLKCTLALGDAYAKLRRSQEAVAEFEKGVELLKEGGAMADSAQVQLIEKKIKENRAAASRK